MAVAHLHLSDLAQAHLSASEAVDIAQRTERELLKGQALTVLAEVQLAQGDTAEASRIGEQALRHHRATGHQLGEARALTVLGRAHHAAGDRASAQHHLNDAVALFTGMGASMPDDLRTAVAS
jgi:tetratricopeptide (TPR) repeat protein